MTVSYSFFLLTNLACSFFVFNLKWDPGAIDVRTTFVSLAVEAGLLINVVCRLPIADRLLSILFKAINQFFLFILPIAYFRYCSEP